MTTYYAETNKQVQVSKLIRAEEAQDGMVKFSGAWGGWVYTASQADFDARFRKVTEAELSRLMQTFEPITVTATEGDGSIEGWTNGELWNGWQVPRFTKETLLREIKADGYLGNPNSAEYTVFLYSTKTSDFIEVTSANGGPLPEALDIDRIMEIAEKDMPREEAIKAYEYLGVKAGPVDKVVFLREGSSEPIVAYEIGNGWCWENAEDFAPKAGTSPKM